MRPLVPVLVAVALLASCTTTVAGSGSRAGGPGSTGPASSGFPAPTPTGASSTSPGPTGSPGSTSAPAATDVPLAPPAQCSGGTCPTAASVQLQDYQVLLRTGRSASGGPASVIELRHGGVAVFWHATDDETPASLACSSARELTCVAADYVGAHGSNATAWRRVANALVQGDTVTADSPQIFGRDLTGDGIVDVVGLQNDLTPDYATGHVQWQTWISDGTRLRSTGCTALAATPPPNPSAPVTGRCAH